MRKILIFFYVAFACGQSIFLSWLFYKGLVYQGYFIVNMNSWEEIFGFSELYIEAFLIFFILGYMGIMSFKLLKKTIIEE